MPHTIIYNSELHIVESKLHGDMTVGEVEEIITKTAGTANEKACRLILADFRAVSRHLSIFEVYELPDRIRNMFTSFGIHVSLCKQGACSRERFG